MGKKKTHKENQSCFSLCLITERIPLPFANTSVYLGENWILVYLFQEPVTLLSSRNVQSARCGGQPALITT